MRVLITGARAPACLEWVRLAQRAGAELVVAADSMAAPMARFSSAATHYVRLPPAYGNVNAYGQAVCEVVARYRIDVILPTCEEAFAISHQRQRLQGMGCSVVLPDFEKMARLHHKYDFQILVQSLGTRSEGGVTRPVFSPETHLLQSKQDIARFCRSRKSEARRWVLKPVWSRFATRMLVGLRAAEMEEACARAGVRPDAGAPWVAQEFIAGTELCSYSLLREGRVLAHACYRPLYRAGTGDQGSAIYFQPRNSLGIRDFARDFGAATGMTGQVAFDYMEEEGKGSGSRIAVLECNPRATSGIHLLADSMDDGEARALLREFLLGETSSNPSTGQPRLSPSRLGSAMLLFAAPPALGTALRGTGAPLRALATHWAAARDVVWAQGDAMPALAQLLGFAELALRARRKGTSLLAASTADIEWNGEELGPEPGVPGQE